MCGVLLCVVHYCVCIVVCGVLLCSIMLPPPTGPSLVSPLNPTADVYSVNFAVVSRNAASMSLCLARAQDGALAVGCPVGHW